MFFVVCQTTLKANGFQGILPVDQSMRKSTEYEFFAQEKLEEKGILPYEYF